MCYDEGILQAYIDDQLESALWWEITRHLERCATCRSNLDELRSNDMFVQECLSIFPTDAFSTSPVARTHLNVVPQGRRSILLKIIGRKFDFMNQYKKLAAVAAMAAVMFTAFSLPAVRSVASEFLTVFRVESVQTINISTTDIQDLEKAFQEGAGKVDIENFGKIEVTGKRESVPVTPAEATEAVNFDLKLPGPANYNEPELHKITGHSVKLTLAVDNINAMLQALGSTQMLPAELDGQSFSMDVPTGIMATYQSDGNKLFVAQSRSPEIKTSSGVDVKVIRDALLSIPALPENLRQQLLAINDLKHTLLIPNLDGSSQEVTVNGTTGVLITAGEGVNDTQSLVWQQNGVIYMVAGTGLELNDALALAAQMK
ncbi:MAG TPA: hypothetical protein DEF34_05395 [Desulfotomaculum sp.]|nr:MAG: hypothetical protein VR67_07335 [Peptococcaceae bacterium BRH_c8a]KJS73629.1 MAG: hypothetical protein JL56_11170 [Desulfotomaculum sp. BICA1-6]HBX23053.1 hypothetical protein [Desulfotomaculum sp.]